MAEEGKGIALVILGVVAIIAVVGLVLLFTRTSSTGALFTTATGGTEVCPYATAVGEPQWLPVLAAHGEHNAFAEQWRAAGFEVRDGASIDEFGQSVLCVRNPPAVPVSQRGPVPLETRQGRGVPIVTESPGRIGP